MQLLALWGRYAVAFCALRSTTDPDGGPSNSVGLTRAVDALSDDVFAQGATGLTDAAVNDLGEVSVVCFWIWWGVVGVCVYIYDFVLPSSHPPPHTHPTPKTQNTHQGSLRALALATGVATGVAGVGFGSAYLLDHMALHALAGLGFLGGYFTALTVLSALDAAAAAVVVQGVLAPAALKAGRGREAEALKGVWAKEGLKLGSQARKAKWPEGKGGDVEAQA